MTLAHIEYILYIPVQLLMEDPEFGSQQSKQSHKQEHLHNPQYVENRKFYLFRIKTAGFGSDNHANYLSRGVRSPENNICQYLSHLLGQDKHIASSKFKGPGNAVLSHVLRVQKVTMVLMMSTLWVLQNQEQQQVLNTIPIRDT